MGTTATGPSSSSAATTAQGAFTGPRRPITLPRAPRQTRTSFTSRVRHHGVEQSARLANCIEALTHCSNRAEAIAKVTEKLGFGDTIAAHVVNQHGYGQAVVSERGDVCDACGAKITKRSRLVFERDSEGRVLSVVCDYCAATGTAIGLAAKDAA